VKATMMIDGEMVSVNWPQWRYWSVISQHFLPFCTFANSYVLQWRFDCTGCDS